MSAPPVPAIPSSPANTHSSQTKLSSRTSSRASSRAEPLLQILPFPLPRFHTTALRCVPQPAPTRRPLSPDLSFHPPPFSPRTNPLNPSSAAANPQGHLFVPVRKLPAA